MEINVLNIEGKDTGRKINLNKEIFGIEPNDHAIYLDVKHYMASLRQGTHKAKHRGEVSGSTRKIKRQKGTGTARAGSIKSPVIVGGGRAFGPEPRDYSFKLNKKVKKLARKSALTYKQKDNNIIAVEDFNMDEPKTAKFVEILNNLKISDKKLLLVLSDKNKNIYLSSRNLQNVNIVTANEATTYDIMNASVLMITESAFDVFDKILKKNK
ncbi:MAG: 50S ribosomal protein L4 [Marinilabiliales bacterium]